MGPRRAALRWTHFLLELFATLKSEKPPQTQHQALALFCHCVVVSQGLVPVGTPLAQFGASDPDVFTFDYEPSSPTDPVLLKILPIGDSLMVTLKTHILFSFELHTPSAIDMNSDGLVINPEAVKMHILTKLRMVPLPSEPTQNQEPRQSRHHNSPFDEPQIPSSGPNHFDPFHDPLIDHRQNGFLPPNIGRGDLFGGVPDPFSGGMMMGPNHQFFQQRRGRLPGARFDPPSPFNTDPSPDHLRRPPDFGGFM